MLAFMASCSGARGVFFACLLAASCGILTSSEPMQSGFNGTVFVEDVCALRKAQVQLMQKGFRQTSAPGPVERLRLQGVDSEVPLLQLESTAPAKWVLALIEVLALGCVGVDRCYMGQPCLGVLKGCTLGGIGVWFMLDYAVVMINCLSKAVEIDLLGYRSTFASKDIRASFLLAVVSVCLAPGIAVLAIQGLVKAARSLLPGSTPPLPSQAEVGHEAQTTQGAVREASSLSLSGAAVSSDDSEVIQTTESDEIDEGAARLAEYGGPVSIRKLFALASPLDMAIFVVGVLSAAAYGVSQPYLICLFGEMLTATSEDFHTDTYSRKVLQVSVTMLITGVVVILIGVLQGFAFGFFVDRQVAKLRPLYFRALIYRDIAWFDVHDVGALPSRMDEDLEAYRVGMGTKLSTAIMVTVKVVCAWLVALVLSWKVCLVMVVTFPILMLAIFQMVQSSVEVTQETQGAYHRASKLADEVLFAIRTVVSFGSEHREIERYSDSAEEARRGGIVQRTKHGMGKGCFLSAYILSYALGFYACMRFAINGDDFSVDKVATALFCIVSAGYTAGQAPDGFIALQTARVSMARVFYFMEHEGTIQKHMHDAGKPCAPIETLELRDVRFSYPARSGVEVLRGMSLIITKGQKVAVVGESGSGKSSAMALMARFYDPAHGAVLVNGVDLRNFSVASYRSHIGYVGQEPVLFATSIRSNILQGSPQAVASDVQRAAQLANLDFVKKLPEKLDTFVGSGGSQFSGGQKQRIAIARALIKKPSLLLLDEATSALDSASEGLVQKAIDGIGSDSHLGVTIVSIAHRLSTVKDSDIIYVIKEGQVVEQGSHAGLMANFGGVYHALAVAQAMARDGSEPPSTSSEVDGIAGGIGELNAADWIEGAAASRKELEKRPDAEITKNYQVPMTRLFEFCRPEWWAALPGLLCAAASGAIYPVMGAYPWVEALSAFVHYSQGGSQEQLRDEVEHACLFFAILAAIQIVVSVGHFACIGYLGEAMTKRCRVAMLTTVFSQELGFHDNPENTPARIAVSLHLWAHRIAAFIVQLGDQADAIAAGIVGIAFAMVFQWQMALGTLVAIPIFGAALGLEVAVNFRGASTQNENLQLAAGVLNDSLNGARTVHAAGGEEAVVELYRNLVNAREKDMFKDNLLLGLAYGFAISALYFILAFGFLLMGHLIYKGHGSFEECSAAFFSIMYAGMSAAAAFFLAGDMAKAKVAACEIFSLLDRESAIDNLKAEGRTLTADEKIGQMQFASVKFSYPWRADVLVLKELSFTIEAGQSIGLVGPSGGGKSTVFSLIQRFYDPQAGEILIGKARTPLAKIDVRWWRRQVGYVGQEPILFDGTVLENVRYGMESGESLSQDRLEEVKRMAHMSFIERQMHGWDTQVGRRGTRLSGGQKQRVAIARAIVRNPSILLFDEATSSLDGASEKIVAQTLNEVSQGRTSLLIAHRLSTVQHCNVILVLEDGRLLESGSHEELVKLGGAYATLRKTMPNQSPISAS